MYKIFKTIDGLEESLAKLNSNPTLEKLCFYAAIEEVEKLYDQKEINSLSNKEKVELVKQMMLSNFRNRVIKQ